MLGLHILPGSRALGMSSCRRVLLRPGWNFQRTRLTTIGISQRNSRLYSTEQQPSDVAEKEKQRPPRSSILSRFLPSGLASTGQSASSFRKIASLAKEEKKPLLIATGLLFASSSVSMTIPFTIGKLIDFFSTNDPVHCLSCFLLL